MQAAHDDSPQTSFTSEPISRIQSLDRIRGFAILGILILNIQAMAAPYHAYSTPYWNQSNASFWEVIAFQFVFFLFDGRFMAMLSMLFGAGLLIQLDSQTKRKVSSRLIWLMLFGFVHGVFLWMGDILLFYGLCGFILIQTQFNKLSIKQLLKRVLAVMSILIFLLIIFYFGMIMLLSEGETLGVVISEYERIIQISIWTAPYVYQIKQQAIEYAWLFVDPSSYFLVMFCMLLGTLLYRMDFYKNGLPKNSVLAVVVLAMVCSFIPAYLVHKYHYLDRSVVEYYSIFKLIGTILMAIIYSHIFIKLSQQNRIAKWFENAGKLALTLYISQSIAMLLLFRVVMVQWYATLNRVEVLVIALLFIVCQLIFSQIYFKYFKQGPIEWVWRMLVKKTS